MTRPRRLAGLVLVVALAGAACTSDEAPDPSEPDPPGSPSAAAVPSSPEVAPPAEDGPGSALAALEELCTLPKPTLDGGSEVPEEGPTPPTIERVMDELEEIRGFGFTQRVVAEPVTQQEIADGYAEYLETAFPVEFYERRSLAWQTIGVIPDGTSIRDELFEYGSTQVIGYYDTVTGELVFIGEEEPSPLERITLAHELTHAIDDQRFGLERIDALGASCRDEELQASLALVEGNATFFMLQWAQRFLTLEEQVAVGTEAAEQTPPTSDVPPFISAVQEWPYIDGMSFVTALEREGGLEAVDRAFTELPVSTEQVIHPERYPNDVPVPVDVPDVAGELGSRWEDLDVQGVGEMWLDLALALRLDGGTAAAAAAGWDGGIYRAWTDGRDVAVVLATAWDTEDDAEEFVAAMERWVDGGDGGHATVLPADGANVRVLFASDASALSALETAVA
ncbi:MAG: hypothetical protein ACXWYN_09970 [Actinomycetota bacterium]